MNSTVNVQLTVQELTMIRVACLLRLDRLKDREDCKSSYDATRAMFDTGGVLYRAAVDARLLPSR